MVQVPTAAGIISGKNNDPTAVLITCTFVAVKDGLGSAMFHIAGDNTIILWISN